MVALAYSLVILFTLSMVRSARDWLNAAIGPAAFSLVVSGVFALCGTIGVVWLVRSRLYRSRGRLLVIIGIGVAYAVCISSLDLAVERIHYLQYGVAAILALRALRLSFSITGAYFLAMCFVLALGAVDEAVQWVLPNRVGELRDVWINVTAGVLGLCLAASIDSFDRRALLPDRRTTAALFLTAAALIMVFGLFVQFVHGFGHCHTLPSGARYKTVFTQDEFETVRRSPDAVKWEDFSQSPLAAREEGNLWVSLQERLAQWKALRHPTPHAFNYEAWRHRQHRDGLANPRYAKYREALEEERILSYAYSPYVDRFDLSWSAEKKERMILQVPASDQRYMSPVQELLVTQIGPRAFWLLCVFATLLCVSVGGVLKRQRDRGTVRESEQVNG
jgi:hypothetical protein